MKRILLAVLSLVLFTGLYCKKEDKTIPIKGMINFVVGTVKLIDKTGSARNAQIGDEIVQGIKIETIGNKSYADIYIGDYIIKVLGNTLVDVETLFESYKEGNKQVHFKVKKGQLFSRITTKLAKGDIYEVKTPTATAAVRGTEFLVSEENGKSNVACLSGFVSVLNNSLTESEQVVLEKKEETDIIPGQNMVKKQISSDKLKMLNILLNIKALREDIRKKFEKQREEIRQHVIDQREKNKEILDAQKEKDKALVDDQKKRDSENIENITGKTEKAADEAVNSAKKEMENTKVDIKSATKESDEKIKSVKPVIDKDKFKVNKDQFKQK
jgi:hypothetical protein